jgi:hypothetical protein
MQKHQATSSVSVVSKSGLSGKTVTDVIVTLHGSVVAIEVAHSTGTQFVKVKQGVIEVGGSQEWGSGTLV